MKLVAGSDHAGVDLKRAVVDRLRADGHQVIDVGAHDAAVAVDYPDYAVAVAREILEGRAERGVLICGSGVGASVAAAKITGIRAAVCHDAYSAHQGVEHDDMNVLVLGARVIGVELGLELVRAFVGAAFTHEARHVRRLAKVAAIEAGAQPGKIGV